MLDIKNTDIFLLKDLISTYKSYLFQLNEMKKSDIKNGIHESISILDFVSESVVTGELDTDGIKGLHVVLMGLTKNLKILSENIENISIDDEPQKKDKPQLKVMRKFN